MPPPSKKKGSRFSWRRELPSARLASGTQLVKDCTRTEVEVLPWLGGEGRDPQSAAELRAEGLLRSNRGLLHEFGVEAEVRRKKGTAVMALHTSTRIGAIPLISPVSGRPDFGLVIEPRFQWSSLGDVLGTMGFRVVPHFLPLPDLPQSERRIPPWVLSSIVLRRLEELLQRLSRRFIVAQADLPAPRGAVDWSGYAQSRLPVGRALEVPCIFPDLRDDEELRAAIHHVLRRHREALLSQRTAGVVVLQLLALCDTLLAKVASTPPRPPRAAQLASWRRRPMPTRAFAEGLQAIEWTVEERGLAGLSDLAGLPWRLDMEVFFEAWVESLAEDLARSSGARLRVGRRDQTRVPLAWQPPHAGSQRSLVPDVVLERDDVTLIFDAKYKRHAEELELVGWSRADEQLREHHRADLLQVLAYSTLFETPRVVACLVYPCHADTFASLIERGRVVTRARVHTGRRHVELALAAVPMRAERKAVLTALEQLVQQPLTG
jgi:hypothetical protein